MTVEEPAAGPDLEIGTPSVDDSSPETGATITLSVTVTNSGDEESAATTLRYYQSADATITTSDTALVTATIGPLAASGTSEESVSFTAPSTAGTYYYGACVDAVTDESDTTNNCSASVQVDVEASTEPPTITQSPDLEVGTPSVDDAGPETGATLTLSVTVTNAGDGMSGSTTLRYYRSTDSTITTSDTQVGTDPVGALTASATSDQSISLTAPSTAGTYYYGACVDSVTDESDTADNCSSSVKVDVEDSTAPPATVRPDLEVGAPSFSSASLTAGSTFTLSATVTNSGDGDSPATVLRYYRSSDTTITTADGQLGTDEVGALAASGASEQSISLTAPSRAGTYYYGACVDSVTDESDTTTTAHLRPRSRLRALRPWTCAVSRLATPPCHRRAIHPVGHRKERRWRSVRGHYAALLPHHDHGESAFRHGGGNGPGRRARGGRIQLRVHRPDRALDRGDVLLWRVRGEGAGRSGHEVQVLRLTGGHGVRKDDADRSGPCGPRHPYPRWHG